MTSSASRTPARSAIVVQGFDAAPRRLAAVVARVRLGHVGHAEMHDEMAKRNRLRDGQRGLAFRSARFRRRSSSVERVRERLAPLRRWVARADRRVHRVERQPRVLEPLRQRSHRDAVVIVEVGARREDLDAVESRAPRSRPGDRDRAAGRGRGAWKCRTAGCSRDAPGVQTNT